MSNTLPETFARTSRKWIAKASPEEAKEAWLAEPFIPKTLLIATAATVAFAEGVAKRHFNPIEMGQLSSTFHAMLEASLTK